VNSGLEAVIFRDGISVRKCAHPDTVARYLRKARSLADFSIVYLDRARDQHERVTAAEFLRRFHAGLLPKTREFANAGGEPS
jgi:hypothetical protein